MVTKVNAPFSEVSKGFNLKLFQFLLPPFRLAEIVRYQGQEPGDIVEMRFKLPFMGNWIVIIKESWLTPREYGFVDRGLRVPLGINYWAHTHRVVALSAESVFIVDEIEYESSWKWKDYLLYLPLLLMFASRKPLYRKFFQQIKS